MAEDTRVAVVGGGIAGITTALRLAQRGFDVTLYEAQPNLGGNVSAHRVNGIYYDVYAHMFGSFYTNFWEIIEGDLGIERTEMFQTRESVKILRKDGDYVELKEATTLRAIWDNFTSGVARPADMLVWVYSMLDLVSQPFHRDELLDQFSVNGFLRSKGYSTEQAAALHDFILMVIWSANSYGVSAAAYKDFVRFTMRDPSPAFWVMRGDLYHRLIHPLEKKLQDLNVTVRTSQRVTRVVLGEGGVTEIELHETEFDEQSHRATLAKPLKATIETVDNLVLAVPPKVLGWLAQEGETGERIVDRIPELSEIRTFQADPIAVLDIYFDRELPGIPSEHVSLWDSGSELSFLDLSQVWDDLQDPADGERVTVLTVAASDYYGLPSEGVTARGRQQNIAAIIEKLQEYLPQAKTEYIDVDKTHFQMNLGDELFINAVGTDQWSPQQCYAQVPNLFFAGGYCQNKVGMATVEAAVTSGLLAAKALHEANPVGPPIEVGEHKRYSDITVNATKLWMLPIAYQAKWWSSTMDVKKSIQSGRPPVEWAYDVASMMQLPGRYFTDLIETATALYYSVFTQRD